MKKIILRILLILFSNLSHFYNNSVKYYTAIQMKTFIIAVMLLLSSLFLTAEKILTFSELVNPHKIIVAGDEIIIEDFPKIYVYSVKDFKLKHSFGKEGEGPNNYGGGADDKAVYPFGLLFFRGRYGVCCHKDRDKEKTSREKGRNRMGAVGNPSQVEGQGKDKG